MECIVYDRSLQKKIPCLLKPNKIWYQGNESFCQVTFDSSKFETYNITQNELTRYANENVRFRDLYPARTVEEIAYANACIPNLIADQNTFKEDELNRYLSLIEMMTEVSEIKKDVFYHIADIISYEILFTFCNQSDRIFMLGISTYQLPSLPDPILVPQVIKMTARIFEKFTNDDTITYNIQNYRLFGSFDHITFPLQLNIPVLKYNVAYIDSYLP